MLRIFRISTVLLLLIGINSSARELLIRLNPNPNAVVIRTAATDDPVVKSAATITNAGLAQKGWMRSTERLTIEGYLAADKLSKNFEIEINAKVYAKSDFSGPVLTSVQAHDPIELLAVDDKWAQVRIVKAMPVYFQIGEDRAPAPIYVPAEEPQVAVTSYSSSTVFNPNLSVGIDHPDSLPPENVIWSGSNQTVQRPPASSQSSASPSLAHIESTSNINPAQADGRIFRLTGVLTRAITSEAPRYALRLESPSGDTVAYVDVSNMYIENIRPYLNQPVSIHGEIHPLNPQSKTLVISAKTIRVGE